MHFVFVWTFTYLFSLFLSSFPFPFPLHTCHLLNQTYTHTHTCVYMNMRTHAHNNPMQKFIYGCFLAYLFEHMKRLHFILLISCMRQMKNCNHNSTSQNESKGTSMQVFRFWRFLSIPKLRLSVLKISCQEQSKILEICEKIWWFQCEY